MEAPGGLPDAETDAAPAAETDADGDGHPAALFVPAGHLSEGDCDDQDPAIWRWMCMDRDDDGTCDGSGRTCVGAEAPAGAILVSASDRGPDSDDADPTVQVTVSADADGDGAVD